MRKLVVSMVFGILASAPLPGEPLKDGDRQRLLANLDMTESWNILEVVEHLAIAEPQYWQRAQDSMKQAVKRDIQRD
jgi:hypothetical protein